MAGWLVVMNVKVYLDIHLQLGVLLDTVPYLPRVPALGFLAEVGDSDTLTKPKSSFLRLKDHSR